MGLIVLFVSTGLVIYFDLATESSLIGKIMVSGLFMFSMASFFGQTPLNPLVSLLLLVVLSIFIICYWKWHRI